MSNVGTIFLDTNVVVYARDRSAAVKGPLANRLLSQLFQAGQPVLSIQVLSEFYWTVTRKLPLPLTHREAREDIDHLLGLTRAIPVTRELFENALELVDVQRIALWDAQIVAAALIAKASVILSEDFQHRGSLAGVTFLNPFAEDFDLTELLAA